MVKFSSVVAAQIFDQRRFRRRDQGFLGSVKIRVTDYLDLERDSRGMFSGFRIASPLQLPTNTFFTEMVSLNLKGADSNLFVNGRLILDLSTNLSTSATSFRLVGASSALTSHSSNDTILSDNNASGSRPANSLLALTNLPPHDSSLSVDNASVNNASIDNGPVYAASVSEVNGPTTIIPGTEGLEERQPQANIVTRPVSPDGTSTADHPKNPVRPSAPGIVSPGRPITNAQHNFNANHDPYGPLPEGWERGIDILGLTYYVNRYTHNITRNRPSTNQADNHHTLVSETTTAGLDDLHAGWEEEERYTQDDTRSTTWVDPRRQTGRSSQPQPRGTPRVASKIIIFGDS
jgi:E3 ubiquitin-protein ligase NEDD4